MRILVTGGAGRLGSEAAKLITVKGHVVVAFDRAGGEVPLPADVESHV